MKTDLAKCGIVAVGAWNSAIFSPTWVAKNVFHTAEVEVELSVGIVQILQFKSGLTEVSLSPGRLHFQPLEASRTAFEQTAAAAVSALRSLPETPLGAIGANVGFSVSESDRLSELMRLSDEAAFGDLRLRPYTSTVQRRFVVEGDILNLSISHSEDGVFGVEFNYHFGDVQRAVAGADQIEGQYLSLFDRSVGMMSSVYGLELEDRDG